jgi:ubiquinone/menaquinone biosynthesis C-methylase UbiE
MKQPLPENTDEKELARQAALNWAKFWDEIVEQVPSHRTGGFLSRLRRFLRRAGGLELAFRIVRSELGKSARQNILEAGCGTGEMSLRFAQSSNRLFMLDTSRTAVSFCRAQAEVLGLSVNVILGSILNLPFKAESFDAVFNVGVLDHFGPEYRGTAVVEVTRILKRRGKAAILTNSSRSIIHPIAMKWALKRGRWPFGFKDAVESLKNPLMDKIDDVSVREYGRGFLSQFEFLHYCLPQGFRIKKLFLGLFYLITLPWTFTNRFPGQYLVTIIEKNRKDNAAHARVE